MLGNLHVRFGEGDEEPYLRKEAERFIPTLLSNCGHRGDSRQTGKEGRTQRAETNVEDLPATEF